MDREDQQVKRPNILVVGSGRRVIKTILPALFCLREFLHLAAVYSRNEKTISFSKGEWVIQTRNRLDEINLENIQIIMVAITTSEVPVFLRAIAKYPTNHITLFLDTPVIGSPRDYGAISYFKQFERVYATEDCYALPSFVLARKIVENGTIGSIRQIYMFHSGFKYHALASVKSLLNVKSVRSIRRQQWNLECAELQISFPGEVRLTLIEPRDYSVGRMMIVGDRGCIVDYPLSSETEKCNVVHIAYEQRDGKYIGMSINGSLLERDMLDELFFNNIPDDIEDKSVTNCLKIQGLMEMLNAYINNSDNVFYDPLESIYDSIVLGVSKKFGRFYDLPLYGGLKSLLYQIISFLGRALPVK